MIHFIVFSNEIFQKNASLEYYKQVYPTVYGMPLDTDWMEVPQWVTVIAGMLNEPYSVYVARNFHRTEAYIKELAKEDQYGYNVFMFSALDENKHLIRLLADRTKAFFVVGGYVDPDFFKYTPNVQWLELDELGDYFDVNYTKPPDYSAFTGENLIPRLSMSEGCLFNCAFCTIPKQIFEYTHDSIIEQIDSFIPHLDFRYVYVNDKTFGQAKNYTSLKLYYDYIKERNEHFQGFIVQTTVGVALEKYAEFKELGVKFMEIGVEFPDDAYLKKMRKPYNEKQLTKLTNLLKNDLNPIGFIPNIMFGIPEVQDFEYANLIRWVTTNLDIISFINPYVYSVYHDAKGKLVTEQEELDACENTLEKSWLTEWERKMVADIRDIVFALIIDSIERKAFYDSVDNVISRLYATDERSYRW